MSIQLVHDAMRTAKSDVRTASERLSRDRRTADRRVFALVERHLAGGSQSMRNGVATGFLEALASAVSSGRLDGPFLAGFLGPESRAYLDAWDQFTIGHSTLDPP